MSEDNSSFVIKEKNVIKLIRGQRGNYGWEIKIVDDDESVIFDKVKQLNDKMKEEYLETFDLNKVPQEDENE